MVETYRPSLNNLTERPKGLSRKPEVPVKEATQDAPKIVQEVVQQVVPAEEETQDAPKIVQEVVQQVVPAEEETQDAPKIAQSDNKVQAAPEVAAVRAKPETKVKKQPEVLTAWLRVPALVIVIDTDAPGFRWPKMKQTLNTAVTGVNQKDEYDPLSRELFNYTTESNAKVLNLDVVNSLQKSQKDALIYLAETINEQKFISVRLPLNMSSRKDRRAKAVAVPYQVRTKNLSVENDIFVADILVKPGNESNCSEYVVAVGPLSAVTQFTQTGVASKDVITRTVSIDQTSEKAADAQVEVELRNTLDEVESNVRGMYVSVDPQAVTEAIGLFNSLFQKEVEASITAEPAQVAVTEPVGAVQDVTSITDTVLITPETVLQIKETPDLSQALPIRNLFTAFVRDFKLRPDDVVFGTKQIPNEALVAMKSILIKRSQNNDVSQFLSVLNVAEKRLLNILGFLDNDGNILPFV